MVDRSLMVVACLLFCCAVSIAPVTALNNQAQCLLGELQEANVVPKNGFEVDHVTLLSDAVVTADSVQQCVLECCRMGTQRCQYTWILWGQCYAVACNAGSGACAPRTLPSSANIDSIYVQVSLSDSPPPVAATPNEAGEGEGSPSREGVVDEAPVARAGADITIHYPELTSVTLDGSGSTDDKGITYYLWQLTTEDHLDQATLINPSLPILKVLNLTPGHYTFTLTVADSSLQLSMDTVHVHVVGEKATASPSTSTEAKSTTTLTTQMVVATTLEEEEEKEEEKEEVMVVVVEEGGTNFTALFAKEEGKNDSYSKRSNLVKIVVPVLFCVALILIVSAVVVGMTFCFCERNKRQGHLYQYKKLPGTIEKT